MVLDKTTLTSMALFFSWLDVGAALSFCHMKAPRKNSIFVLCFLIIWLWIKLTHSPRLMCSCLDCVDGTGSLRSRVYWVFYQFIHSEGIKVIPAGRWLCKYSQSRWFKNSRMRPHCALAPQIDTWFLFYSHPFHLCYTTIHHEDVKSVGSLNDLRPCCMGFQLPKQWANETSFLYNYTTSSIALQ